MSKKIYSGDSPCPMLYCEKDGESFDTLAVNKGNTSKLTGYGFFKLKQDSAAVMVAEAGMI